VARLAPFLLTSLALSLLLGPGCGSEGSQTDEGTGSGDEGSTDASGTDQSSTAASSTDESSSEGSSTAGTGTGTSSTDESSTGGGTAPEDILACGLETFCSDQPIEASVTGAWTGDDYVEEYRCVLETLLQTLQEGASAAPGLLRLGTNLYGDSPANDDVAVGYEDGTAMYFAHGYVNGAGPWEDPHQSCALREEAQYQACLDSPTTDCIGISALLGPCQQASPDCP